VAGRPILLIPAAEGRAALLASISVASIDRSLVSGTALVARAVPLPLDPAAVKEMLLSQAGLPPQVAANLDTASPAGVVFVSPALGRPAGVVMAIPVKGGEGAKQVTAALGRVVARRGPALEIEGTTGGRGFLWQSGNVLVLSDSAEGLGVGAQLALEARKAGAEDVTAVLFPDAIARANGTDVKTALAKIIAEIRATQAARRAGPEAPGPGAAGGEAPPDDSLVVLESMLSYLADAGTVEVGLTLDGTRGLVASARLHARPDTALARATKEVRPFEVNPTLFGAAGAGGDVTFMFASSHGAFLTDQIAGQRRRLQASREKGAESALQVFDTAVAAFAGQLSGAGRVRPDLAGQIIYPLKDAASAAKLGAALMKMDKTAATALWKAQVGSASVFDLAIKKESVGKLKTVRYTLTPSAKGVKPAERDAMKRVMGGPALVVHVAVSGTRLLSTFGKDAKARMAALAAGKTGEPTGALAEALTAAKGRDSFAYVDLGATLGFIASFSEDPRATALAGSPQAAIPVFGTLSGDGQGKTMTISLTLPPGAFAGIGTVMQGMVTR
jgi:hypothetical protein